MDKNDDKWLLGRRAMVGSLLMAHIWATVLVYSVLKGQANNVAGDMFSASCLLIFSILGVLVGGKGWKDFAAMKFGGKGDNPD